GVGVARALGDAVSRGVATAGVGDGGSEACAGASATQPTSTINVASAITRAETRPVRMRR
ncbi:MAG: hypothetical protein ACRDGJ_00280, partial [Candidatus Limnocylindria bacterium]